MSLIAFTFLLWIHSGAGTNCSNDCHFSCDTDVPAAVAGEHDKYLGAVMVSSQERPSVVFVPYSSTCVGVYSHPVSNATRFSCIDMAPHVPPTNGTFAYGTLAEDGRVVFAPRAANCVGTFDPTTYAFECSTDVTNDTTVESKFHGAALAPTKEIIFAPTDASCIGIFSSVKTGDVMVDSFACVDISDILDAEQKFSGAATAPNGLVVFTPMAADCVGTFEAYERTFNCIEMVGYDSMFGRFSKCARQHHTICPRPSVSRPPQ